MISPEEFKKEMISIAERNDPEIAHLEADRLLCKLLIELGYGAGVKVFEEMDKWYA